MLENNICSISFEQIGVMDTGRLFSAEHLSPLLYTGKHRPYASHLVSDQCPMTFKKHMLKQELLKHSSHKSCDGIASGPLALCGYKLLKGFSTPDEWVVI